MGTNWKEREEAAARQRKKDNDKVLRGLSPERKQQMDRIKRSLDNVNRLMNDIRDRPVTEEENTDGNNTQDNNVIDINTASPRGGHSDR